MSTVRVNNDSDTVRVNNDQTRRVNNDDTVRVTGHSSNVSGVVFNPGQNIVLNGKNCVIVDRLNKTTGEAHVYKITMDASPYALKLYKVNTPLCYAGQQALARIKSNPKNRVIQIFDFGKYNGQDFEIMEFAQGGTLDEYINKFGAIKDIKILKFIVAQIREGLNQLHGDYRIIYQDLKPENIYFLDPQKTSIVLADFGISGVMDNNSEEAEVIANLTDLYAAPELGHKGARKTVMVTPAVDYYALGITIFQLWLGEEPFRGMSPAKRDSVIRNREVSFPSDINADLKMLIQGLIDPLPVTRWADFRLQKWLNGEPLTIKTTIGEAMAHYNAGRYKEAIILFQALADQGHAEAQNKLGECYYNGDGVGYNGKKAVELFKKSAKHGHILALVNLGECYELGNGVKQNYRAALNWYKKAAKNGNAHARDKVEEIKEKLNPPKQKTSNSSYSRGSTYNDVVYEGGWLLQSIFMILPLLFKIFRFMIIPLIIFGMIFGGARMIPNVFRSARDSTINAIFGSLFGSSDASSSSTSGTASSSAATIVNRCNFRAGPSTNDGVIRQLEQGTAVTLTGEVSGSWRQIIHNGDTGWVSSEFLRTGQPAASTRQNASETPAASQPAQSRQAPVSAPSAPFAVGDTVFAAWTVDGYYLAEIVSLNNDGTASVRFYDGSTMSNARIGWFDDLLRTRNTIGNYFLNITGPLEVIERNGTQLRVRRNGREETIPWEQIIFTTLR